MYWAICLNLHTNNIKIHTKKFKSMSDKIKKNNAISRRKMIPILGGGLLLPFVGYSSTVEELAREEESYQTLLRPDGTAVRVKSSTVKTSKVVKKNVSNSSFLNWLGKKL